MRFRHVAPLLIVMLASAAMALAQGVQTGMLSGMVKDEQDLAIPGVTVTSTSSALQGPRTGVTDVQGRYAIAALPAGDYQIAFELSGFATVTLNAAVPLGLTVEQNVSMRPAGIIETVQVVAGLAGPLATPIVGMNFKHGEIESLATPRAIQGIALLSPAVTQNSPSANQVVINGAFAFDNIFMINGVDINDNLRAQPQNLFIEDAIEETQVLTSGISAEFGRFTGGVINAVTKSGGNKWSGSFRVNFLNPAWTDETPFEKSKQISRLDKLQETNEATLGGPIVKDRLWFFAAGRYENTDASNTLPVTAYQYTQTTNNKRGEVKLTASLAPSHTVQGGYLNNSTTTTNGSGALSFLIDEHSLDVVPVPNWYYFTNYHGVLNSKLLAEAQYSERRWMTGGGGTSTNIVDSPFFAATLGAFVYNAPYFDGSDQEQRNNRQFTGSVTGSWYKAGSHVVKSGYEFFRSQRSGGGSQSSTNFVFDADFALDAHGTPLRDATGHLIPMFVPGVSGVEFIPAARGAVLNVDNNSLFVQDHWVINSHWSADLGARFEHVGAESTGGIVGVNSSRIVPRLAAAYDVQGNGTHVIHATYGMYSGRYNEQQIGGNSPVVNAPDLFRVYVGPVGQGRSFAPGFDFSNYPVTPATAFVVTPPPANVSIDPSLKSPVVHEITGSYGINLMAGKGYAEGSYVFRKTTSLIEDFQTIEGGFTDVILQGIDAGLATNKVFKNTDVAHRQYQALVFQSRYRISNRWSVNGHYTVQLENNGNYEGETNAVPGATSLIGNYPEAFDAARFYPDGRLQDFQRHRLRLWSVYDVSLGQFGDFSVSGFWRVDSGRVYSLTASVPLTADQARLLTAAGYPDLPSPNLVYFGERGSQQFNGSGLFDTSINYNVPVFATLKPWIKIDVFNLFNNDKLISWNTAVKPDPTSSRDGLGLPTASIPGALFGQATSTSNFPASFGGSTGGRTFRVGVGFRF